jgi:hypothetical protein
MVLFGAVDGALALRYGARHEKTPSAEPGAGGREERTMDDRKELTRFAIDFVMTRGACVAGVSTTETLAGGPPSTDLEYVLPDAKSAVTTRTSMPPCLLLLPTHHIAVRASREWAAAGEADVPRKDRA